MGEIHHSLAYLNWLSYQKKSLTRVVMEGNDLSIKDGRVGITIKDAGDNLAFDTALCAL